jgi:hypothetical protein
MTSPTRASLALVLALPLALSACSDEGEVPPGELSGHGGGASTSTTGAGGATTTTTTSAGGAGGATTTTSGGGGATSAGGAGGGATSAGGAGGAGGTTTTTSGSGGGGGGGGTPCTWQAGKDVCGAGLYCDGCAGVCVPQPAKGAEGGEKSPVCGCDGNTYWNASVAASHLVGVASAGACSPGKTCGGFGGKACAAGLFCNYSGIPDVCLIADAGGTCWGMPAVCTPEVGFGPASRECGAAQCAWECDLVKKQVAFEVDGGCPQ